MAAAAALTPSPALPEWERGGGTKERCELARRLGEESRGWFLNFVERFLDADVAAAMPWDREHASRMLSYLKRVNDWLGEIGKRSERLHRHCQTRMVRRQPQAPPPSKPTVA
jgi:hypothetical protein